MLTVVFVIFMIAADGSEVRLGTLSSTKTVSQEECQVQLDEVPAQIIARMKERQNMDVRVEGSCKAEGQPA